MIRTKILPAKKTITTTLYCLFTVAIFSCSSPASEIQIDSNSWKSDLNGCKGERVKLKKQVQEVRLKLLGLHERDIRKLFGKPDSEELLEKSQKIYIYFINPGPKCNVATNKPAQGKEALTVRMDALGNVREANIFGE